ncbi:MAG: hypothetical protein V7727_04920 [Sneathiella sp.]
MIGITALITAGFGGLALLLRPGGAFGILIVSMLVWPEYLRIPVGPAEMSAPRLVALALLVRLIMLGRHRGIKLCSVDWLVFFLWLWTLFATIVSGSDSFKITSTIGSGFDTVLMYFVARLAIRSILDIRAMALPLFGLAIFMAAMGWMEAITFNSPYLGLDKYRGWIWIEKGLDTRYGMLRAKVSTSVHIYFGIAMMIITGIAWAIKSDPKIRKMSFFTALFAATAAFSAISSGPWLGVFILIFCNAFILKPSIIKPSLYMMMALAILLELVSNRHFYNLIDYIALNSGTAYYRTKLMEVAVSQWRDYWLVGVGDKSIQYWGSLVDSRLHVDLVNQFVIVAVNGGIPAFVMYLFVHINAIRYAIKARRKSIEKPYRNLLFCLVCTLIALDFSSLSVGLFGPPSLLANLLLGMMVSISMSWKSVETRQPATRATADYSKDNSSLASDVLRQ